jgi:large subunit ribosomal protein L21
MYAILQQSGHQYRVSPGDRLLVDRLAAEVGSVVALEPVVLVQGDGDGATQVGTPVIDGVRVAAVVVGHPKGGKLRVFKYKPKKHYRRTHGHRSLLTELRIEAVLAAGEKLPEPKVALAVAAPEAAPAPAKRGRSRAKAAEAVAETGETVDAVAAEAEPETAAAAPEAVDVAAAESEPDATAEAPAPKRRSRAKKAAAESTENETDTETPAGDGETEA